LTPRVKYVSKYKGNRRVKGRFDPKATRNFNSSAVITDNIKKSKNLAQLKKNEKKMTRLDGINKA